MAHWARVWCFHFAGGPVKDVEWEEIEGHIGLTVDVVAPIGYQGKRNGAGVACSVARALLYFKLRSAGQEPN